MNPCRNSKGPKNSERGIGLLGLLLVLPGMILLLAFFLHRWGELRDSKSLRADCRESLARGQSEAGRQISRLLTVNLVVKELKIEKALAVAAIAAAVATQNYPALVKAKKWLAHVEKRQQETVKLQKLFIVLGTGALWQAGWKVRARLHSAPRSVGLSFRDISQVNLSPVRLAVRKVDADEKYPEYELEKDFSERQMMELTWQSHYRSRREENTWSPRDVRLPESCGMSLVAEKDNDKNRIPIFRALPMQAKYFWKR